MAQWCIRGIAVAGVLAFGWAAHGQSFDPVPAVAARRGVAAGPARGGAGRRRTLGARRGCVEIRSAGCRCASRPTPASSPTASLRGARPRLRRRPDARPARCSTLAAPTGPAAAVDDPGRPAARRRPRATSRPRAGCPASSTTTSATIRRAGRPACAVRARPLRRCLRRHRPRLLRQPAAARVRLHRRARPRSGGDPPAVRRRRAARDRRGRRPRWSTSPAASRCASTRPITYQVIDGVRREVESRYVARGANESASTSAPTTAPRRSPSIRS